MASLHALIREAAEILARAEHAVALTGAGVSTPSGIPDFRGPRGLWRRLPPELFEIGRFRVNPESSWRVFVELYDQARDVKPNPAHYSLAWLERNNVLKAVITQNIDGLHQAAKSVRVIELHGNLSRARCISCGYTVPLDAAVEEARVRGVPRCPKCGGVLKPDVVFFGEHLPSRELDEAFALAYRSDAIIVAGSSLYVTPARYVPVVVKSRGGRVIVVVEGDVYPGVDIDVYIEAPVEKALPAICREIAAIKGFNGSGCESPPGSLEG